MGNFFDNERLFVEYGKMRENKKNYTDTIEIPAILELLPERFDGLNILDACCGSGKTTRYFAEKGANLVLGIDISERMIEEAKKNNHFNNAVFICSDIGNINPDANVRFDIVFSSAAFHFVKDLDALFSSIYSLLKNGGIFCFSMEHPCMSANSDNNRWILDKDSKPLHYCLKNYFDETYREHSWFSEDITVGVYHRKFSTILNSLIKTGFSIEQVSEPAPNPKLVSDIVFNLYNTRPSSLIIKCKK